MHKPRRRSLVFTYIYLAAGCVSVGTALSIGLLLVTRSLGIDLLANIWLLAIPTLLSVFLNVLLIELFRKISRK